MWWYWLGGAVILVIAIIAYLLYRGYSKVKPKPIPGIPCPPLSHPLLGHPDRMLHPLKHEMRLEIAEAARAPLHQLVLMTHSSVFVNEEQEAAQVLQDISSKGRIYGTFRYNAEVPDILACEGEAFQKRKTVLESAFQNVQLSDEGSDALFSDLMSIMNKCSDNGESFDANKLFRLFGLDVICKFYFGYKLDAVAGSEEGANLLTSLQTHADANAAAGIYPSPDARKVPVEELNQAKSIWKNFLEKIVNHIKSAAESYKQDKGSLNVKENPSHALVQLTIEYPDEIGDRELMNEVNQLLRHGHESIAATLMWLVYDLYRNKNARYEVEKAILQNNQNNSNAYPKYLENFIKESLRRHPAAGNMTVRTPSKEDYELSGFKIPVGTPIHVHMFSLQNTKRTWKNPKEFNPDRWNEDGQYPKCPFMTSMKGSMGSVDVFDGVGFEDNSLSFFPFSTGHRSCMGKNMALSLIRRFLYLFSSKFRMDPVEPIYDEDIGVSLYMVIAPVLKKSTTLKITRILSLAELVENGSGLNVVQEVDEGWADE